MSPTSCQTAPSRDETALTTRAIIPHLSVGVKGFGEIFCVKRAANVHAGAERVPEPLSRAGGAAASRLPDRGEGGSLPLFICPGGLFFGTAPQIPPERRAADAQLTGGA